MIKKVVFIAVLISGLSSADTKGGVSLYNGNFYIGYTDFLIEGPLAFGFERVYNSKSPFDGMFGVGWGCNVETFVKVSIGGEIVIYENGGGAYNFFTSEENRAFYDSIFNANRILLINHKLKLLSKSDSTANIDSARIALDILYSRDPTELDDDWQGFVDTLSKKFNPESGSTFLSKRFGDQLVLKTKNGYTRVYGNGTKEYFDEKGMLVKIENENLDHWMEFSFMGDRLFRILDTGSKAVNLFYNDLNKVERILMSDGRVCTYHYSRSKKNNSRQLIYSRDVDGNEYSFLYDERINLTRILYSDSTTFEIQYYDRSLLENVKHITDRDGSKTYYRYQTTDNHVHVQVSSQDRDDRQIYWTEYIYKEKGSKSYPYIYKQIMKEGNKRIEIIYNEDGEEVCRRKKRIKRGT